MDRQKRRRANEDEEPQPLRLLGSNPNPAARVHRKARISPSPASRPPTSTVVVDFDYYLNHVNDFVKDKISMYQQFMEEANEQLKRQATPDTDFETLRSMALEHRRQLIDFQTDFPPPGHHAISELMGCGSGDNGLLGLDLEEMDTEYAPMLLARGKATRIVKVAAGGQHSMALDEEGHLLSWGVNDDGTLGRKHHKDENEPSTDGITTPEDIPGLVDCSVLDPKDQIRPPPGSNNPILGKIIDVQVGNAHSVILTIHGDVYACGMYKDDSCKFRDIPAGATLDTKCSVNREFVKVQLPGKAIKIACGTFTNAAILEDLTLVTWGIGNAGQLARARSMGCPFKDETITNDNGVGTKKTGRTTYRVGHEHFAREETVQIEKKQKDGSFKMVNDTKEVFDFTLIQDKYLTPHPVDWAVPAKREVLSVAGGDNHLLVVARLTGYSATSVYSAGSNFCGQTGQPGILEAACHALTKIEELDGEQIGWVAAGQHHSMALQASGNKVFAWGQCNNGECGIPNDDGQRIRRVPTPVAFPPETKNIPIRSINCGESFSSAIFANNDIYAWGNNYSGNTGHSSTWKDIIFRPKKLTLLKNHQGNLKNVHTLSTSGGAQHSLFVVNRYSERK